MNIDLVTLFPAMAEGYLNESMMKRAVQLGAVRFSCVNPRDFTEDAHRTADDRPYGGGPGMVMLCDPLFKAVEHIRQPGSRVILATPQGQVFNQAAARRLASEEHLIFVAGHYEGVDERVREHLIDEEFSIGDYVLTNGALASMVMIDAIVRLQEGVLGGEGGAEDESFSQDLLEYPQYTRPSEYRGWSVPDILLSGNHGAIEKWRREQSVKRTQIRRPDLLEPSDRDMA